MFLFVLFKIIYFLPFLSYFLNIVTFEHIHIIQTNKKKSNIFISVLTYISLEIIIVKALCIIPDLFMCANVHICICNDNLLKIT